MKVFLSWSGEISLKVARALREWLPCVIQVIEPYVSSEDIDKGARWSTDIAKELETSGFGILCITKDNVNAPWIHFEAGALSKSLEKSRTCPFLFNLKRSEVDGPLLQFQSTIFEKSDVQKLINTINSSLDSEKLEQARLDKSFDVWWPKLESDLKQIDVPVDKKDKLEPNASMDKNIKESNAILEEMLELLRTQLRILRSPEELLPQGYIRFVLENVDPSIGKVHKKVTRDLGIAVNRARKILIDENIDTLEKSDLVVALSALLGPSEYVYRNYIRRIPIKEGFINADNDPI